LKNFPSHRPRQIEFVEQRRKTDCGIACIAMLTKHLYNEVIEQFPELKRSRGGLYPHVVVDILDSFGYDCNETYKLPQKGSALVAVQWKQPNLSGHYVVWDSKRRQFLDPQHGIINQREMLKLAEVELIWRINKRG
jgi:ABC-type bacteriocin/lantibiotic exporter with double-glycine peptidase domain